MSYLLDTNVVSEIRKRKPDPQVLAWWDSAAPSSLFISVLSLGDIRMGIERLRRKDEQQAAMLDAWLAHLRTAYADRIVPVDAEASDEWARLNVPDPLPTVDGLLAATAKVRGWVLVTRNTSDLAGRGVELLNPWTPAGQT